MMPIITLLLVTVAIQFLTFKTYSSRFSNGNFFNVYANNAPYFPLPGLNHLQ